MYLASVKIVRRQIIITSAKDYQREEMSLSACWERLMKDVAEPLFTKPV